MKAKIAEALMNEDYRLGEVWCAWNDEGEEQELTRDFYRGHAKIVLSLLRDEVSKLENPYSVSRDLMLHNPTVWGVLAVQYETFETERTRFLDLLEKS